MGEVFKLFLSTPSARRATSAEQGIRRYHHISIHALREEGDVQTLPEVPALQISIHALREEGDKPKPQQHVEQIYFYPRPPRGGRLAASETASCACWISIHALREEGDHYWRVGISQYRTFLSTPSARRATFRGIYRYGRGHDFYPRPPRGGRPELRVESLAPLRISIHALREEGDFVHHEKHIVFVISIHALREEGDAERITITIKPNNFYPRPPRGGRRPDIHAVADKVGISIHALREEGDMP